MFRVAVSSSGAATIRRRTRNGVLTLYCESVTGSSEVLLPGLCLDDTLAG